MPDITVSLTTLQIGEISHKVQIVADEQDLQDSYEITKDEAQALADLFLRARPGDVIFDERYRDLVVGELEDRMESLHSNWKDSGNEIDGGLYRSLSQAVKRIKDASPSEDPIEPFTDQQWWKMCDAGMSLPVPLHEADLTRPFVYDRAFGVFPVPGGKHQVAMSLLLAWQHGCSSGVDVAEKLALEFSGGTADRWLEVTPGAAFLSSVGKRIQIATGKGLTVQERRLFGDFERVFE